MAVTGWLIDKSAYADAVRTGREHGRVERSYPAGSRAFVDDYQTRAGFLRPLGNGRARGILIPALSFMPIEYLTPAIEDRAWEVQMLLADRGQHRAPSVPDLLIAATAEKLGLSVLAVDKDFGLIAQITGQQVHTLALG